MEEESKKIDLPSYDSGLIVRVKDEYKVSDLRNTVAVNPSLLNAPIYVLNASAARKLDCIEVNWAQSCDGKEIQKSFRFIRAATTPFPTVTHAKYLDILLSMFSQNWNEEGVLHFRYCDVLRIAGKAPVSRAREAIQHTIIRYHRHTTEWENSWNGRVETLTFNIIRRSSIFDQKGDIKRKTSGNSKNKDHWHTVVFDAEIVKALKNETKRILLTDLFKKLDHSTFCVYRYYYGYPDYFRKGDMALPNFVWRNIPFLINIFKWTGQKNRFVPWLEARFAELYKLELIDEPKWNKNRDAVGIHCKNLKEIQKKENDAILLAEYEDISNVRNMDGRLIFSDSGRFIDDKKKTKSRKSSTKPKKCATSKLSNDVVLEEFYARKAKDLIPKSELEAIDLLLANDMVSMAIPLIKSKVLVL